MKRAGLPLSVGQASPAMRVLLALILAATAALCIGGGVYISSLPAARAVAVLLVIPVGLVVVPAVAFVLAPHSAYGDWLDRFVPRLREPAVAATTAIAIWTAAFLLTWIR